MEPTSSAAASRIEVGSPAAAVPTDEHDRDGVVDRDDERIQLLARLSELDRRLKQGRTGVVHDRHEELQAYQEQIAALNRYIEELRQSESWRLGNGLVRAVLAAGRPVAWLVGKLRRIRRSRAASHDRAYRQAIAPGSPLATVDTARVVGQHDADHDPLSRLVRDLRSARAAGPRLLDAAEIAAIRTALASADGDSPLERPLRDLLALSEPLEPVRAPGARGATLVVDVRVLQLPFPCGTKTHGEHVVRAVCSALPETARALMLTSPRLPDVDPAIAARFDGQFVPGSTPLEDVTACVLMTFADPHERLELGLLRAPWVRRASVWLDGIVALYPTSFLPDDVPFLHYQVGIEKLGRATQILTLSDTSRRELPANLPPDVRITISGSRPGLGPYDALRTTARATDRRYCALLANGLPHKNLAAGVAAFARSRLARAERLQLVVVATIDDAQQAAVRDLAESTGLDTDRIVFHSRLDRRDLAGLVQAAEAVVVPSLHEGFSLPIVEALGLATPVAASDIPAHRELLGTDPALGDPRDPAALAAALDDVLAQPGEVLARQARALAARYDPRELDRAVEAAVSDLVSPPLECATASPRPSGATRKDDGEGSPGAGPRPVLSQSKVCNLEDFSHPELVEVLHRHFPHEVARFGPRFPQGREWRKHWELAMALRTFTCAGLLDEPHDFLGVGAGNEPTIFLLTRHARRVVATDLYLESGWEESANASMLADPGWSWPFSWRPERLEVASMNALDLRLPDGGFHAIFSSSSIEHLGSRNEITRALDEMYRVLAPGGILSVSSEFRIAGPAPGAPGVAMFDVRDIDELFVGGRDWSLIDPFDDIVSSATMATVTDFTTANDDQHRQIDELGGHYTHLLEFVTYPHVVLSRPPHIFTSFHLALQKAR